MKMTIALAVAGCILLFVMIWVATITMPFNALTKNFPLDIQERLKPRLASLPMSPKRVIGGIWVILLMLAWLGLFIWGGIDGKNNDFGFWDYLLRFLIIGGAVKAFDVCCLDYILLTKTHFFQHYFPETEGCKGWQQFGYNRKQQLRQCIIIPICCLIGAWVFCHI